MRPAHVANPVRSIIAVVWVACGLLGLSAVLGGCATPISHGDSDLPNFQQVSDTLYRGGQPTRKGCERLSAMGIKTILNVRGGENTDLEFLNGVPIACKVRPMSPWKIIDDDVVWFLKLASDPANGPIFLHCHRGSDRTGCLVAMYRVVVQGWERDKAIAEMTADGNGFHSMFQDLIDYVRTADVTRLRQLAMLDAAKDTQLATNKPATPSTPAGTGGNGAAATDHAALTVNP